MVFDNYMWSGDALWIAIGTIIPVVLIESEGAAPMVDNGGAGGRRGGRSGMIQGNSGMRRHGEGRAREAWVWEILAVIMEV